jgi:hypothetical protein
MKVRYVIYEIDDDKYWCGGRTWSYYTNEATWFKDEYEAQAAMNGLYRRSSSYNLMYRKIFVE